MSSFIFQLFVSLLLSLPLYYPFFSFTFFIIHLFYQQHILPPFIFIFSCLLHPQDRYMRLNSTELLTDESVSCSKCLDSCADHLASILQTKGNTNQDNCLHPVYLSVDKEVKKMGTTQTLFWPPFPRHLQCRVSKYFSACLSHRTTNWTRELKKFCKFTRPWY